MLVTYIRSSSYNNYDYCGLQYYLTYNLGYQSPSGKKAVQGTVVHKVLEVMAGLQLAKQNAGTKRKLVVDDDMLGKVSINKSHLDSYEIVNELLDQSFDAYTAQENHHEWYKKEREDCRKWTWAALQWNEGQFDPRNRNIVAPEPHFDIPIEEDWAKFKYTLPNGKEIEGQLAIKGTIDLVTQTDEDTIEVIDWKTGRRIDWATGEEKTYDKLLSDPQLLLYNYAISKLFPDYKQAIMTIFFIKDGGPFSMCFDASDKEKFLGMLKNRFQEIQKDVMPKPISPTRSSFKCTKLCHFYKTNWPGTNQNMCMYIEDRLHEIGMAKTTEECTRAGHSINYYEAPG
mgnify:FL=1